MQRSCTGRECRTRRAALRAADASAGREDLMRTGTNGNRPRTSERPVATAASRPDGAGQPAKVVRIIGLVRFAPGSAFLLPASRVLLDAFSRWLTNAARGERFYIEPHEGSSAAEGEERDPELGLRARTWCAAISAGGFTCRSIASGSCLPARACAPRAKGRTISPQARGAWSSWCCGDVVSLFSAMRARLRRARPLRS